MRGRVQSINVPDTNAAVGARRDDLSRRSRRGERKNPVAVALESANALVVVGRPNMQHAASVAAKQQLAVGRVGERSHPARLGRQRVQQPPIGGVEDLYRVAADRDSPAVGGGRKHRSVVIPEVDHSRAGRLTEDAPPLTKPQSAGCHRQAAVVALLRCR